MEELRSTDVLDREIEIDAKKKADRILQRAREEEEKILSEVDARVEESYKHAKAEYESRILQRQKNAQAYIPLEKERFLVSYYDRKVNTALNSFFDSMSEDEFDALLASRLLQYESALSDKKLNVRFFGLEKKSAEKIMGGFAKNVSAFDKIEFNQSREEACPGNEKHAGLLICDKENTFTVRLTMDELFRQIKDKYSYELAASLFDGRLPK